MCRAAVDPDNNDASLAPLGEDSAAFDIASQSKQSWALFFALLTGVLGLVYAVWIAPGMGLGDDFIAALEGLTSSSEAAMIAILAVFAAAHSGLAFLRPYGEAAGGRERRWRPKKKQALLRAAPRAPRLASPAAGHSF